MDTHVCASEFSDVVLCWRFVHSTGRSAGEKGVMKFKNGAILFALLIRAMWFLTTLFRVVELSRISDVYICIAFDWANWVIICSRRLWAVIQSAVFGEMAASSSRGRSSSPFSHRKPSTPYSSTSSSSSMMNGRLMPRSCSSSATSFYGASGGGGYGSRSAASNRSGGVDYSRSRTPVTFPSMEEPLSSASRSGDSISVTIRFRPLRWFEFKLDLICYWFVILWIWGNVWC